jgi:integrase
VVNTIVAFLPRLREQDPPVWAFAQIVIWTGARSCQVRAMRGDALRAGGIQVPEAKGGKSPLIEVAAEILDDLGKIATPGSVLGTEAPETVYRRFNAWLRFCGLQGTLAAHALRHARLQQYRSWLGVEVAAAAGGHQTTDMVQQNYTAPAKVVPMLVPWERAAI